MPEGTASLTKQPFQRLVLLPSWGWAVQACKMQTVFKKHGVKTGDKVTLYLPMVMPLPVCMLACTRMGAVLNIVFAGVRVCVSL